MGRCNKDTCADCQALEREHWPRGAVVYICADKDKPAWVGSRRVLDYRASGCIDIPPARPAWCEEKKGEQGNGNVI